MKRKFGIIWMVSLCLAVLLGGCAVNLPDGQTVTVPLVSAQAETSDTESATGTITETLTDTVEARTPAVVFPLYEAAGTGALSAREIFAAVSPAVAYVETPSVRGSAVLVEPGYLVTNAHVVWPFNSVRLVFPDGTEYEDVAVLAWDLVADLAILEAPDVDATPLHLADGAQLPIGSELYLIGYPGEIERFPQPALTQGLLARIREWAPIELTMLQIDADVSGGQSGGPLVNEQGDVIGITTYSFADAGYALVSSAADIAPRLESLLNEEGAAFSDRRPLLESAEAEQVGQLEDNRVQDIYFLDAPPESEIEIEVDGPGMPSLVLFDTFGQALAPSEERADGHHVLRTETQDGGLHFVAVFQASLNRNTYTLSSNVPLTGGHDPDDGVTLAVGETYVGNVDVPGDIDVFELELEEGERVVVEMDSMMVNPITMLIALSGGGEELVLNDDSEGGLFGLSARLVYASEEDNTVTMMVADSASGAHGGYYLTVSPAPGNESVTEPVSSREFYQTQYGRMELYEDERYDFSLLYPAGWTSDSCSEQIFMCFQGPAEELTITPEGLDDVPMVGGDPERYVDVITQVLLSDLPDGELISREPFTSTQGLEGELLSFTAYGDLYQLQQVVYFDEAYNNGEGMAYNVGYVFSTFDIEGAYEIEQRTLFGEYLLSSLQIGRDELDEDDPLVLLERGMRLAAQQQWEEAVATFTEAIDLDPELAEAYQLRATAYSQLNEHDRAIQDLETLIELAPRWPGEAGLRSTLALAHWINGDTEQALAESDKVLALEPDMKSEYNNRVFYRASTGDYDAALAELEIYGDDLPLHVLDSRAYTYLKMGEFDLALADYEEALEGDFQVVPVLLGAGVTYSRLGETEQALPLLAYGLERLEESGQQFLDPQTADLADMAEEILAEND